MVIAMNTKILIVDDNPQSLKLMSDILETEPYDIIMCLNSSQLFEYLDHELPDLILLDVMTGDISGIEICKQLKSQSKFKHIPVLFVSARVESSDIVKGLNAGAVDYIPKPFRKVELLARIKTHLEIKRMSDELKKAYKKQKSTNDIIQHQNKVLRELNRILEEQSIKDPLTNMYNRRYTIERIKEEMIKYERYNKTFSIMISDIDFFKQVNDTYGHSVGDQVLVEISYLFRTNLRKQDIISRWGGEEFLILLLDTKEAGSLIITKKILEIVDNYEFKIDTASFNLTMSIGVSTFTGEETLEQLIKYADEALYYSKNNGKNQVNHYNNLKNTLSLNYN